MQDSVNHHFHKLTTIKLPTLVPCMGGVGLMAARMMMYVLRTVYTLANTVTSLEDVDGNHKAVKQVNALAIFDSVATMERQDMYCQDANLFLVFLIN